MGQLLGPLVLAFLMVFTVLATVTPQAQAAVTSRPEGKVLITTEPDFNLPNYDQMGPTGSIFYPWQAQPPGPTTQPPQVVNNPLATYPKNPATVYVNTKHQDPDGKCPGCFQRTVRVAFNDMAVTRIDFVAPTRDAFSTPVCSNTPVDAWAAAMDPCKDHGMLRWRPEYSYATRPGWAVSVNAENAKKSQCDDPIKCAMGDDTPPARIMSFTSDVPNPVPSLLLGTTPGDARLANALDIVLAFSIDGTPSGDDGMQTFPQTPADEFHVQINVTPSGNPNIPFETTCPAWNSATGVNGNPQSPFTCVYTNPPFKGPAPVNFPAEFIADPRFSSVDCGVPGGLCTGTPGLVIRVDNTPPEVHETSNGDARVAAGNGGPIPCVCSFFSQDVDHNGHIDRFIVSFTEPLNPNTFDFRQFSIQTKGRDRPYTITNAFFEQQRAGPGPEEGLCLQGLTTPPAQTPPLTPIRITYPGSTCRVDFLVAEMPFMDSGDTPNLKYPCDLCPATATDRAGNPLKKMTGTTILAVDRAPPILYSTYALDAAHNGGVPYAQTELQVFFSENVMGSGCNDPQAGPPATCGTRPVQFNDLCYMDNVSPGGAGDVIGKPTPDLPSGGRVITSITTTINPSDTLNFATGPVITAGQIYYIGTVTSGTTTGGGATRLIDTSKNFAAIGVTVGMIIDFSGGCSAPIGACTGCFSLDTPYDTTSAVCQPAPKCRYFDLVDHTPAPGASSVGTAGDGWKMRVLTMLNPTDTNNRLMYGSADVHPFNGDMITVNVAPHGLTRGCFAVMLEQGILGTDPCNADVRDLHDNGAWYPTGLPRVAYPRPPALAHVTFPMVKSATVDSSNPSCPQSTPGKGVGPGDLTDTVACHYWLKLQFNGPVRGPNGPASCDTTTGSGKTAKPFFACNLDIKAATGKELGQGPQGFFGPAPPSTTGSSSTATQAPYYLMGDNDQAVLQMDYAARPIDVSLSGARVKLVCNTIFATPGWVSKYSLDPSTTGVNPLVGAIPCDDPDQYYGPQEDFGGVVQRPDIDIVDLTPPRILEARTVDADHNGYLDGVQLTFSEPIDDGSYCGNDPSAQAAPNFCPDTESGAGTGYITFSRWTSQEMIRAMTDVHEEECFASSGTLDGTDTGTPYTDGFKWDTGTLSNDNVGTILHVRTLTQQDGSYITRPQDCNEYFRGVRMDGLPNPPAPNGDGATRPLQRWPTDSLLHITSPVPGLFSDLATHPFHDNSDIFSPPNSPPVANPNQLPRICQFESRAMTGQAGTYNQVQSHPSAACDTTQITVDSVRVTDGAPPVLWKAQTYDTPVLDVNGIPDTKNFWNNLFGDGTIDGYRLTFSERVNDGSFVAADWHVAGHDTLEFTNPTGCSKPGKTTYVNHEVTIDTVIPGKALMRTRDTTLNPFDPLQNDQISQGQSDDQFILLFTPAKTIFTKPDGCKELHAAYDTETKPELTASGPNGHLHMADRAGLLKPNPICPSNTANCCPGGPSINNCMVDFDTFAVQEEDRAGPQIVRIEGFAGTNHIDVRFSEPVDDGSHSGLVRDDFQYFDKNAKDVAGFSSTEPVESTAGGRNSTIHLGQLLTVSDQTSDKIAARTCRIYEVAPSVSPSQRQCVPSYPRSLVPENDTAAPGALSDFRIVAELTNANSLTASWTAPADDGTAGKPVSGYTCLVGTRTILGNETNDNRISFSYDPPVSSLAGPGLTQTVRIAGLDSEAKYYIACYAKDDLGNLSPLSEVASGTTTRDVTPPTGTITIKSPSHPAGVPTAGNTISFTWNAITKAQEPESTVVYHYALNTNPNYVVLATDGATQDTKVTQLAPGDGTYYFHVAAMSGGGSTLTAHYQVVVGLPPLTVASIESANDLVKTEPFRQEQELNGQTVVLNNVTWTLPPDTTPPGLDISGVEIWREDHGIFTKLNLADTDPKICSHPLSGSYDDLKSGHCWDTSLGATADSKYKVTMVFATPPHTQGEPVKGYAGLVDQTPGVVPPWIWILAGIALALILSGLVIFVILKRRSKLEATGGTAYSWESANPELLGIDEATGLPVHEVRCPSCNNPFQAVGALPLPVTCPTCGTTGELE
ncbi:MAG: hypothetical protein V4510_06050 [bacterium]